MAGNFAKQGKNGLDMRLKLIKHEDTRVVRKFAWFPVDMDDHRVWLEFYWEKEIFISSGMYEAWLSLKRSYCKESLIGVKSESRNNNKGN